MFGGFAEKAWDSSGQFYDDQKAFLFSLVNKGYIQFTLNCCQRQTSYKHANQIIFREKIYIISGTKKDKHQAKFWDFSFSAKLGMPQCCRDNVTMFSG